MLPLVNTSGDPSNEYFSDGLSEELIAVLAKIPELKVIGRSSSFFFKGKSGDSAAIGQKLGVANLIEGSVRKQGDRVRIVAELISAADGRSLWSETYDRELKDVFAVQDEIAKSVAEQMKVKLLGEKPRSDAEPSNENPAAHNAVLQSDFYFQQQTPESVRKSIAFLQDAVRLDPNYALAYAKLGQAWRQYAASFAIDDASKAYDEARQAADKAVSLAPDLVDVRMTVGLLAMNPGLDFPAGEKEFRHVLQLSPNNAAAKNGFRVSLLAQGRLTEAEEACRQALLLDPLLTNLWFNLGRITVGTGRYKEAGEAFRKGLELQPNASRFHTYLATLDVLQNRPAQATDECATGDRRFLARLCRRFGATSAGRPTGSRRYAQGFYRQGFERRRISDRCALRNSKGARRNVQVARYRLCHARFRSDSAASHTFLPPLSRRPAFHRIVPEAQCASAFKPDEVMNEPNFFAELKRRNVYKVAVAYAVVGLAADAGCQPDFSIFRHPQLGSAPRNSPPRHRLSDRADYRMGI